jgi:hypothetical protein
MTGSWNVYFHMRYLGLMLGVENQLKENFLPVIIYKG